MGVLSVDREKCNLCMRCQSACPFGAIELDGGTPQAGAGCKSCGICVKECPRGAIRLYEREKTDLSGWSGILVYGEYGMNGLHPVVIELIGKAKEIAKKCGQQVICVLAGQGCTAVRQAILDYGVDRLLVYDDPRLACFLGDLYANLLEDAIHRTRPGVVLVGATPLGRSLAPRVAARLATGLTADCTTIDITPDGELIQIRPAFGGNIMAQIATPYTRPQFATVRYKVMEPAQKQVARAKAQPCMLPEEKMWSPIRVEGMKKKEKTPDIVESERLVVAGRGVRTREDLALIERLADELGAQLAGTRPMIENGWIAANRQIGLSGRTVKPRLLITCGVSGAVQFIAGMKGADCIVSINNDPAAPIFSVADYAVVGDLYTVIPRLADSLKRYEEGRRLR